MVTAPHDKKKNSRTINYLFTKLIITSNVVIFFLGDNTAAISRRNTSTASRSSTVYYCLFYPSVFVILLLHRWMLYLYIIFHFISFAIPTPQMFIIFILSSCMWAIICIESAIYSEWIYMFVRMKINCNNNIPCKCTNNTMVDLSNGKKENIPMIIVWIVKVNNEY